MEILKSNVHINNLLISFACIIMGMIFKWYLYRNTKDDFQNNILVKKKISQTINYIIFMLLLFIWMYQYKEALFSMVAIAAAIVIAFKEVIMCFTGGLLLNISNSFNVGDRIEIDEQRGFVLEKGLLSIKLFEIGPERNSQQATGDVITLPNSIFLSHSVKNESYFAGISIKTFKFLIHSKMDREKVEKVLLDYAFELSSSYIDQAKEVLVKFCKKEKINIPSIEPRIKLSLIEDKLYLLLKVPVTLDRVADIEQKLIRKFAEFI